MIGVRRLVLAVLLACMASVILAGCGKSSRERFLAERRAEVAGYRLQYVSEDKSLVLHQPNGETDHVDVPDLARVMVYMQRARDSVDNKDHWYWWFETQHRMTVPFFAAAPSEVISILAKELPGFDEAEALGKAHRFEMGEANFCLIWLSDAYVKQYGATRESQCRS
jgi:hypothetical protein